MDRTCAYVRQANNVKTASALVVLFMLAPGCKSNSHTRQGVVVRPDLRADTVTVRIEPLNTDPDPSLFSESFPRRPGDEFFGGTGFFAVFDASGRVVARRHYRNGEFSHVERLDPPK